MSRFKRLAATPIDSLGVTVHEFEHETGASYLHFEADHPEHAFLVAFRTLPQDSTGVAHILEHTALCGSERYPVRDPFFTMLRRSLSTFMNAFTTSDYTAYPFASTNEKDFANLLSVYLDAVFFPTLDPLDFAQEGHRLEFETPDDSSSPLVYRGVVFNEMKGDMSSSRSQAWERIQHHLFSESTYHFNSGGDPAEIPKLKHSDLLEFYRYHYHPSNAMFMTWGRMDPSHMMKQFESLALGRFEASGRVIEGANEPRWLTPKSLNDVISGEKSDDGAPSGQLYCAWLLGSSTDLEGVLTAQLVVDLLLDSSASPLRRALDQSDLGHSVSPLSGLEESNREMSFLCGLEMADEAALESFETLVMDCLASIVRDGISIDRIEAALHQLELSQRELGGDGMPYGLQVMFSSLSAVVHRGDPVGALDFDRALSSLRAALAQQGASFVSDWIQKELIDNPHRLSLSLGVDEQLAAAEAAAEREKLSQARSAMSEQDVSHVISQSAALNERQLSPENLACLPKVGLNDVPTDKTYPQPMVKGALTGYAAGCNGLVYEQLLAPLPALAADEWSTLPLLSQLWGELGVGANDYLASQERQLATCGGISAYSVLRSLEEDGEATGYAVLSTRGLVRHLQDMSSLLLETFHELRLDEWSRISQILQQIRSRKSLGVVQNAHSLAMLAACGAWSRLSARNHQLSGLGSIARYDDWCRLVEQGLIEQLSAPLARLHGRLTNARLSALVVSDASELDNAIASLSERHLDWSEIDMPVVDIEDSLLPKAQAFITSTQANFSAACLPCVREQHPDAAALMILARVLSQQYLHPVLREQGGAYGGGASYDQTTGLFRFYSYRDPELIKTLDVFRAAGDWVNKHPVTHQEVEEAVLSIVSGIDAPGSPAGEARTAHHQWLQGRSEEMRRAFRRSILAVTPEQVMQAAETYLKQDMSMAVVTSKENECSLPSEFVRYTLKA